MILRFKNGNIYLKKNIKSLLWFEFYYFMFYGFIRDFLNLPDFISYGIDLMNIILFAFVLCSKKMRKLEGKYFKISLLIIMLLFISTLIGFGQSTEGILQYLWGFRNIFRFYIYFIICSIIFDLDDLKHFIVSFKRIYIINFPIMIFQFLMGYEMDYLGGIFGVQTGCNGPLNLFLIIVSSIYILEYLSQQINLNKFLIFLSSSLLICGISELKIFLFELIIIILGSVLLTKFNYRKVFITFFGILSLPLGMYLMGIFFPQYGIDFFTGDGIINYLFGGGYSSEDDLNRFTGVYTLYKMFFEGNILLNLFGLGLGNASTSVFSFLNTQFHMKYGYLHYLWLSDTHIYIELGLIGLILFELFFICCFLFSILLLKKIKNKKIVTDNRLTLLLKVSVIVSILSIVMSIYNASLTVESGYIFYTILAVPVIIDKLISKNPNICKVEGK